MTRDDRGDAGILNKLLVPPPRSALITGKAFAAGVKSLIQAVGVIVIAALLGGRSPGTRSSCSASRRWFVRGSAFFSCLSMTIAVVVLGRDRLMGFGQVITMPLFFGSNALHRCP